MLSSVDPWLRKRRDTAIHGGYSLMIKKGPKEAARCLLGQLTSKVGELEVLGDRIGRGIRGFF